MFKLTRYISIVTMGTTLIVLATITTLFIIFNFITQVGDIGKPGHSLMDVIITILLQMPENINLILPMAGLLGTLMGLGILANSSELTAMRAAGLSITQIGYGVISTAMIITLLGGFLGAYLAPKLSYLATLQRKDSKNNPTFLRTDQATWIKVGDDFISIDKIIFATKIQGITRYHVEKDQLKTITKVKNAHFSDGAWALSGVSTNHISRQGVSRTQQKQSSWKELITPKTLTLVVSELNSLTLSGLISYIQYRHNNGLSTTRYELQLWKMLFNPLSIFILMTLAIPFVFGPLRSSNKSLRLVVGVLIGFAFYIINQFFGPFALINNVPPFLGAALPTIIFFILLFFALWRSK